MSRRGCAAGWRQVHLPFLWLLDCHAHIMNAEQTHLARLLQWGRPRRNREDLHLLSLTKMG